MLGNLEAQSLIPKNFRLIAIAQYEPTVYGGDANGESQSPESNINLPVLHKDLHHEQLNSANQTIKEKQKQEILIQL